MKYFAQYVRRESIYHGICVYALHPLTSESKLKNRRVRTPDTTSHHPRIAMPPVRSFPHWPRDPSTQNLFVTHSLRVDLGPSSWTTWTISDMTSLVIEVHRVTEYLSSATHFLMSRAVLLVSRTVSVSADGWASTISVLTEGK